MKNICGFVHEGLRYRAQEGSKLNLLRVNVDNFIQFYQVIQIEVPGPALSICVILGTGQRLTLSHLTIKIQGES